MNTQAVYRGGDILLDSWQNEAAKTTVSANQDAYEGELIVSYEDRDEWVRDALKLKNWQELESLPVVAERKGLLLWAVVGQEEDRSAGFPIRYVKLAIAVPKAIASGS